MNATIRDDGKKVLVVDEKKDYSGAAVISATYRARLERERAMRAAAEASCSAFEACTRAGDAAASGAAISARAKCPCAHAIYCGADCQKAAWPAHKEFCKMKRAELLDIAIYEENDRKKRVAAADAAARALLLEEGYSDDGLSEDGSGGEEEAGGGARRRAKEIK